MTAEQLEAKYGIPNLAYQAANCVMWFIQTDFPWFPVRKVFINKDFKDMLFKSFTAVQAAGLQGEIITFNGCYVQRDVRGSNKVSAHAYAGAMDLDADADPMFIADGLPLDDPKRLGGWSKEFVDAMTSSGVYFGGYFLHRADPMHFSMADM